MFYVVKADNEFKGRFSNLNRAKVWQRVLKKYNPKAKITIIYE